LERKCSPNVRKRVYRFKRNQFTVGAEYAGWGNLDDEDKKTNEEALKYPDDLYVMGTYDISKGKYGSSQIEFLKRQRARNAKKQDS